MAERLVHRIGTHDYATFKLVHLDDDDLRMEPTRPYELIRDGVLGARVRLLSMTASQLGQLGDAISRELKGKG